VSFTVIFRSTMMRFLGWSAAASLALASKQAGADDVVHLDAVVVTAPAEADSTDTSLGAAGPRKEELARKRAAGPDAAHLLLDIPGVGLHGAGGISSLPEIHGLSDDRLRIQVDGMDLVSACPNHMNAPLSYVSPSRIASVEVFDGVSPVSVGGDSIGGSIRVRSAAPNFATREQKYVAHAEAGSFYRSNGNGFGYNLWANAATRHLSLSYAETRSRSDNYQAGGSFKPVSAGTEGGRQLAGNEVGSSAFHGATNRSVALALRLSRHLVQVDASRQTVDFEGFPNQRMDMTANQNWLLGLRYTGQFAWGDLQARLGYQDTRHEMDMGPDRFSYGTGMPMKSKAKDRVAAIQANIFLSDTNLLRSGTEYQHYSLYDWWPPVGGVMGPNAFWNIDYGRRDKLGVFAEWEGRWRETVVGQVGVRSDWVESNAAAVQGYDNGLAGWGNDAVAFNTGAHRRSDVNWDVTTLLDYSPGPRQSYQAGWSRKSRSPNLYQRFAWSSNAMAALMNNFVGDGNGTVGNLSLRPEAAYTVSLAGDWHSRDSARWKIKATGYYTHIQDYMDARRCDFGQCSQANTTASTGFVLLQYVNQSARIYGGDLSGRLLIFDGKRAGSLESNGRIGTLRGQNLSTGDDLYQMMPLNGHIMISYRLGPWSMSPELVAVARKERVSRVRNEVQTDAYWLLNLHSALAWKHVRIDGAVENLLDRLYANPLGGAYLGQGPSMTTNGIPWGVAVPGRGRSFSIALGLSY
jgi:iron complex outermembrane recepter protein